MRVAVLGGGRSSEHDVSIESSAAVRKGLAEAGHEVVEVLVERDGTWRSNGDALAVQPGGGLLDCDVAWPVLHGPFGEDGTVQGLLELLDIPYVGAGVLASSLCMDKVTFKHLMAAAGVPQVAYAAVREAEWQDDPGSVLAKLQELGAPLFVKPARLGSSVGIARVDGPEDFAAAVAEARRHDPRVIVEGHSGGLEIECSVLGHADTAEASEPGEIVVLTGGWYDYEAKYTPGGMELVVPARISDAARARVRSIAVEAFARADCDGLARVDFFVDGDDVLLNELNTMPGFTSTSVYAKLWEATGLPYVDLVERLCALGIERFERDRAYRF
jgi:D-alanine-D-alanine ligase